MAILIIGQLSSKYGMILQQQNSKKVFGFYLAFLAVGYACLIVRGLVWVKVVSKGNISLLYPLMSLSVAIVMLFSALLFNEELSMLKIAGVLMIITGTGVIATKQVS